MTRRSSMRLFPLLLLILHREGMAIDGPLTPEQSLTELKTEPGLKVELVAAEPMVVSPVAVAWDERGRMFVVEDRGYPLGPGKGERPVGQVVMLEDTDGDGKYDKRTVYVDGLTFPNGVMPWNGGIYVTCAPYLYYFKDSQGDGKVDVKQVVFKGFQDLSTTQLRVSHPTLNIDNWVYLTSGLTAAKVTAPAHTNLPVVFLNRVDGRFRPGTDELQETAGTAQFGQAFDSFGRKFICSNRNHIQQVVLGLHYLKRNPNFSRTEVVEDIPDHGAASRVFPLSANITTAAFHAGYFTSACGLLLYGGTALPEGYRGNSFTCEPAGNLVHRDVLKPGGVTFVASRAYPTNEFLASPDNWFRPVNLANGPGGALYVCDMYRKTIEHPEYLPEATRKVTDFESGKTMGRIYRIVSDKPGSAAAARKVFLANVSTERLVDQFNSPNVWTRMTAHRLLLERRDKAAVPTLVALVENSSTPEARVHALRILDALDNLTDEILLRALGDKVPAVRENGIQVAESRATRSPALLARLSALADDSDPRVRFQCALSLGDLETDIVPALVKIIARNPRDKWTQAAVLSSVFHREEEFFHQLLAGIATVNPEDLPQFMGELGHILATAAPREKRANILGQLLKSGRPGDLHWQMAAVAGFGRGLRHPNEKGEAVLTLPNLAAGDSGLEQHLNDLFRRAGELAADDKAAVASRLPAVSLLAHADYSTAGPSLGLLLGPREPSEIQSAAIRALGEIGSPAIGTVLVKGDRWNGYTPAVRDTVLGVLMGDTNSISALLTAIEKGDAAAWTVNADRRSLLMKHKDEAIRNRATILFKDLQPGDRMKAYEEAKGVLQLKPDSRNGHAVFQKNCTPCHVVAGEGKTVGPDLTGIRNQPAEVLLLHIVVPEYEIMPIYTCYNVETTDGQSYTGLLAGETPSAITLRMAQGVEQQIPRSNIGTMMTSRLSLMPQELEKAMSKQDLADLIGFLKGE